MRATGVRGRRRGPIRALRHWLRHSPTDQIVTTVLALVAVVVAAGLIVVLLA